MRQLSVIEAQSINAGVGFSGILDDALLGGFMGLCYGYYQGSYYYDTLDYMGQGALLFGAISSLRMMAKVADSHVFEELN